MAIVRTGKLLTPDQLKEMIQEGWNARHTPVILLTQRHLGPNGKDEATLATERFHRHVNALAAALGLPDPGADADGDPIHYGFDTSTGEVLGWRPD